MSEKEILEGLVNNKIEDFLCDDNLLSSLVVPPSSSNFVLPVPAWGTILKSVTHTPHTAQPQTHFILKVCVDDVGGL